MLIAGVVSCITHEQTFYRAHRHCDGLWSCTFYVMQEHSGTMHRCNP